MRVPFLDLETQHKFLREKLSEAIAEVLDCRQFILGPIVQRFEKACAKRCQSKYALGVSSGTDALLMALMALNIGAGDEVITTDFSFFATASVIFRIGAKPIFVDIDPETYNLDSRKLAAAVTKNTKAILPVHLYGQCAEMDSIVKIARENGLAVVEDAAQAFGAAYRGKVAGSLGDIGCFSFYPTKNLGGIGEGGLVTTQNSQLYDKLLAIRNQGDQGRGPYRMVGGNFRMDAVQAAALQVKLELIDHWNSARLKNAGIYRHMFKESSLESKLTLPKELSYCKHIYHQYVIRVKQREKLQKYLGQKGVDTTIYYPRTLTQEPCVAVLGYDPHGLPESALAASTGLALPIFPSMSEKQIAYVVKSIEEFYKNSSVKIPEIKIQGHSHLCANEQPTQHT